MCANVPYVQYIDPVHDANGEPALPLNVVFVRMTESADEWTEQWDLLRRRLARQPRKEKVPVAEMIRAYEEATGTCVGCD
jgi:hypothetical protein